MCNSKQERNGQLNSQLIELAEIQKKGESNYQLRNQPRIKEELITE